jgi:hypothetical protein
MNIIHLSNSSGRTMPLEFSLSLTEMNTQDRNKKKIFLGSKRRPVLKAAILAAIYGPIL